MRMLHVLARVTALLMTLITVSWTPAVAQQASVQPYEHYAFGRLNSSTPEMVSGGLLLMGGGDRNIDSMKWFFGKAGKGHIVVISASYGEEIGQEFYHEIGGIESAEIFVFHDRSQATDNKILDRMKKADGIFIAGGDQARYVRYWRGTPVEDILNAHAAAGKPLAGTSAGLAILGEKLYGAMDDGSIKSPEALADPLGPANTIEGDFLELSLLKGVITDSHFKERARLGRLLAFLAKGQTDRPADLPAMIGVGVDESAALAVEPDGSGRIYATEPDGYAWIVDGSSLRGITARGPLDAPRVKVTGVGPGSVVHLPSGKVDAPVFVRTYAARAGSVAEAPN